jgi:mannitol-1-phosphate 5-dehydrogenase
MKKTLVQFGAGNIGRSFIGQLFSRSGYEVVFVDIDDTLVRELNTLHRYRVIIKRNQEPDQTLWIENVRAVHGSDTDKVAEEIKQADIVATSVGKGAIPHIIPVMAAGIKRRFEETPSRPIDVIIAENIREGSSYYREQLKQHLPEDFPLQEQVGLVETSIGKMVPIMRHEDIEQDPLWVFAEAYNTLIVDRHGFINPLPQLEGLHPVDNITAYVDRKLFIHNMGHAATAYFGFEHDNSYEYIWEPLEVSEINAKVHTCMHQAAVALNRHYPNDLPMEELNEHIEDLIERFRNRALGDTIYRVGRDLYRKLHKNDRLVGAMLLAQGHGLPFDSIADAVVAALHFRAADENGELYPKDKTFVERVFPKGIDYILQEVCGLSPEYEQEAAVMETIKERSAMRSE